MPVLPQKTEADSIAALHACVPYLVWLICRQQLLFQSYLTAGCCMRIAYQMTMSETMHVVLLSPRLTHLSARTMTGRLAIGSSDASPVL